uniref:Uncharacterized protein n=1 Tax=Lactuca sativa TaxID=4236 RepID=A0A9R1UCV0_LACSA|nr:hypothetical protein LSAT_V11C900492020 [Lactuca sativa]
MSPFVISQANIAVNRAELIASSTATTITTAAIALSLSLSQFPLPVFILLLQLQFPQTLFEFVLFDPKSHDAELPEVMVRSQSSFSFD